jgi:hypothetical protein
VILESGLVSMEAIEELTQLSESMRQASALLADEDVDESSSSGSSRRASTFLNVVALGNVVSPPGHLSYSTSLFMSLCMHVSMSR